MLLYLLTVYVYIFATILWVGYMLFWAILTGPLTRKFDPTESIRLKRLINQALWAPPFLPLTYRIQFRALGWLILLALIVSEVFSFIHEGNDIAD
jgi:hypothetical protein